MSAVEVLRRVRDSDLLVLFEQQRDAVSNAMAGVGAKDRPAFDAHWEMLRGTDGHYLRTIFEGDEVVGYLLSWEVEGKRHVGYWIGQEFWGRGYASRGLQAFLEVVVERPLFATISIGNSRSQRVLQKSGFQNLPVDESTPKTREFVLEA